MDTCVDISPILNPNIKLLNEFEHFTNSILSNKALMAPAEHGVYMMEIIDHFYQAASKNEPVFFEKDKNKFLLLSSSF